MISRPLASMLSMILSLLIILTRSNCRAALNISSTCGWPIDFQTLCMAIQVGGGTVTLCANTVYSPDPLSQNPLKRQCEVRRSDLLIQCGEHGHVEDNCVIDGGNMPIAVVSDDSPITGVRFRGITFRNTLNDLTAIKVENGNEVTFENCAWEKNTSKEGAIVMATEAKVTFINVSFSNNIALDNHHGSAIVATDGTELVFNDSFCLNDNDFGGLGTIYIDLISSYSADLSRDCSFNNNIESNCHYVFSEKLQTCVTFDFVHNPVTPIESPSILPAFTLVPTNWPSLLSSTHSLGTLVPSSLTSLSPTRAMQGELSSFTPSLNPTILPTGFPKVHPSQLKPSHVPSNFPIMDMSLVESATPSKTISEKPSLSVSSKPTSSSIVTVHPSFFETISGSYIPSLPPSVSSLVPNVQFPVQNTSTSDRNMVPTTHPTISTIITTPIPTGSASITWTSSGNDYDEKSGSNQTDIAVILLAFSACAMSLVSIGYILFSKYFIPFFRHPDEGNTAFM